MDENGHWGRRERKGRRTPPPEIRWGRESNEMKLTPFLPPPPPSPQASLPPAASNSPPLASAIPFTRDIIHQGLTLFPKKYSTKFAKTADTPRSVRRKDETHTTTIYDSREKGYYGSGGGEGRGYRASERPAAAAAAAAAGSGHLLAIPSPSPLLSIRVCQDLLSSFFSSSLSRGEASFRSWYFPSG